MNSELRQDLVSGEWIIVAPYRLRRPGDLIKKIAKRKISPKNTCPFENPLKSGHKKAVLIYPVRNSPPKRPFGRLAESRTGVVSNGVYPETGKWELQIIQNKFPALVHKNKKAVFKKHGRYNILSGVGHHELLITADHYKNFEGLSLSKALHVFQAFRDRYLVLMNDKNISYVSIFQNWGPAAGASIYHPHYQIIALPVVPPDVTRSLLGSRKYFKKHKTCVHCAIIKQETKDKKRIIFENSRAVAFSPFASPNPYEIAIFPKRHLPFFENTFDEDLEGVAEALKFALHKIRKNLKDPDYNFFLHTSPVRQKENYKHYHWHIEILPKFSVLGGFEFGTGAMINVVEPDEAAEILRGK